MFSNKEISALLNHIKIFISTTKSIDQLFIPDRLGFIKLMPWHGYYEISVSDLFYKMINAANLHQEMMEYIFSSDPIETALEISKQDCPKNAPENPEWGLILSLLYAFSKTYESILYHQQTIHQLLKKIERGHDTNDNLLQKIIQIDKAAIYCAPIQKRIQQAQLSGDHKLFGKIANVLRPRNQPQYSKDADLTFMIFFLMDAGLYQKMTEHERFETLKEFKQPHIDEASFMRKLYRISNLYV